MVTNTPSQNAIGRALGLSSAAIVKLKKRGMPVDSVEAAQAWRAAHLHPGRAKGGRADSFIAPEPVTPALVTEAQVAASVALLDAAERLLALGQDIGFMLPTMRAALRAVPVARRPALLLPVDVMQILAADVLELATAAQTRLDASALPSHADAPGNRLDGAIPAQRAASAHAIDDAEAEWLGAFWYRVAAGEITLNPSPTESTT